MAMEERKLLESWKEISAYLKRSERTCRRFEETLDLPVHRLDGTPSGRVFAYSDELDRWLQEKLNHAEAEEKVEAVSAGLRRRRILIAATGVVPWLTGISPGPAQLSAARTKRRPMTGRPSTSPPGEFLILIGWVGTRIL